MTVGWVEWWDGAGATTFLGDGNWVLNHSRLGGVVGWGWGNDMNEL